MKIPFKNKPSSSFDVYKKFAMSKEVFLWMRIKKDIRMHSI